MSCAIHLTCGEVFLQLLGIGLSNGAVIALNAIGVTLVYGAIRTINFAYGDVFALTTVIVTTIIGRLGLDAGTPPLLLVGGIGLVLVAAVVAGGVLNAVVERIAFRPFRSSPQQVPLIATIGLSFVLFQVAILARVTEASYHATEHHSDVDHVADVPHAGIPELIPRIDVLKVVGLHLNVSYMLKDLLVLIAALLLAGLVTWFLRVTRAGRALRACAQDPQMAELCGVDRNASIRLAFALGGALAGIAALIWALYYGRPFGQHGAQSGLVAFAAAVLGGIGNPIGALWSGLLFGIVGAGSDYFLEPQWTPVLVLGLLIGLLLLRPSGLAGEARSEDAAPRPNNDPVQATAGRNRARHTWITVGMIGIGLLYPLIDRLAGIHEQFVITNMLMLAVLALGLNILLGFAGLLDLGYAAIFAIGGYTTAFLTDRYGWLGAHLPGHLDFLVVLGVTCAVTALFGGLNGLLTQRLRGDYLAIVTLAFGQLVPQIVVNLGRWTGGVQGLSALPPPRLLGHNLNSSTERYYLVLAALLLVALASQRLIRSRIGRAWKALSADQEAALSCGVPMRSRLLAFAVGAAVAGLGGALWTSIFSYVNTDQAEFSLSALLLAMVIIGGAGNIRGVIVGALLVASYDQFAIRLLGGALAHLGQTGAGQIFAALDVRTLSYGSFGLALYLTVLLRSRRRGPATQRSQLLGGLDRAAPQKGA